jgi:hypothetical protein
LTSSAQEHFCFFASPSYHFFSYQEKAQRTKRLILSKPFNSTEKLIKYVQFVAENDGILPELQNEGRNLNFIVYHNLDIFVPLTVFILFLIYLALKSFLYIFRAVFLRADSKKMFAEKIKKQ